MAQQITSGAYTDLECARRIVNYLDANYLIHSAAHDQQALRSDQLDFLSSRLRGTSMDFATATVMLVRSVGIPARLVTGYIPGAFDPLSGTYAVRAGDRHAWAEMYVGVVGWVPFDATPVAADLDVDGGGAYESKLLNSLFNVNYGEAAYGSFSA